MENAILCLTLREVGDGGRSGSCSCLLFSRAAFIPESGTIKTTVACVLYLSIFYQDQKTLLERLQDRNDASISLIN